MKKFLLSLSALALFATGSKAQTAPDFGVETWVPIAPPFVTVQDPAGWVSLNALTVTGSAQSVFKVTTPAADVAAGAASAKIVTVKVVGSTIPSPYGGNLDTAGILAIGKVVIGSPPSLSYGYSSLGKPGVLSFKSKYTPMAGDSAFVLAYLTHWNGTSRDTVATGKYATGASTTTYSTNSISMAYKPAFATVTPDSEEIFISSSVYSHDGAKIGSAFYVDAFGWSAYVGVNDIDAAKNTVTAYPNPAASFISVKSSVEARTVQVTDITGRVVGNYTMRSNIADIQTSEYANGTYTYIVIDANKIILSRGKFEVAH